MKLKFKVFALGEHTFHSKKLDKDVTLARLMGTVFDAVGDEIPALADLAFDGSLASRPSNGDVVLLDVTEAKTENAMLKFSFTSVEPVPARELKQK